MAEGVRDDECAPHAAGWSAILAAGGEATRRGVASATPHGCKARKKQSTLDGAWQTPIETAMSGPTLPDTFRGTVLLAPK